MVVFDMYIILWLCYKMWAIPTGANWLLKKKKNQVESPSIWSRIPETGSNPPIGSNGDSGRDNTSPKTLPHYN